MLLRKLRRSLEAPGLLNTLPPLPSTTTTVRSNACRPVPGVMSHDSRVNSSKGYLATAILGADEKILLRALRRTVHKGRHVDINRSRLQVLFVHVDAYGMHLPESYCHGYFLCPLYYGCNLHRRLLTSRMLHTLVL